MYEIVAISTETVEDLFGRSMLGRVSIVDEFSGTIYDRCVKPVFQVRCYRTAVTGLRREHLMDGTDFNVVQAEVLEIIRNAIVVGYSLQNQFALLKIFHPVELVRDVAVLSGGLKLNFLCEVYLDRKLQKRCVDSVETAATCMQLYWKFIHQ